MKVNFVQLVRPLTESPLLRWLWKADGKLYPPEDGVQWAAPWRSFNLYEHGYDCRWEHQILHDVVFRQQAVPAKCMDCYKVVLFIDALVDVYIVEAFQQGGNLPCKVGSETRSAIKGRRYGAYWYCVGVDQGKERYVEVKEFCESALTGEWKLLLKRGCSEFEQHLGPSDKWYYSPDHAELEELAEKTIMFTPLKGGQPQVIVDNVHAHWEEWDKMTTSYVTYQDDDEEG